MTIVRFSRSTARATRPGPNISTSVRMTAMELDRCELLCVDLEKAEALRATVLEPEVADRLADRAKALGDPTRLRLAAVLRETDELCVCDLAWIAGRAEKLISHHLRALRSAGPATNRRGGG